MLVISCVNMCLSGVFKSTYHTWVKTLISGWKCCLVETRAPCWKSLKSGAPSAKMSTLGAPLFSDFQQSARHCTIQRFQPEMTTFCHFCTGRTTLQPFSAKCTSLRKLAFSTRDEHVLSFSHWTHHFFSDFEQSARVCWIQRFSPTWARFVISALGAPLFSVFSKVHLFLQIWVFRPRSARFSFLYWAPLFSYFQQCTRICAKQRFQPEISMLCHFRTRRTTL